MRMHISAILVGLIGCLVISASSLYTALRLGALPWPLFLAALTSYSLLKCKNQPPDFTQINVAHTMMTSGSMIAGAVAFVLPAVFFITPQISLPLSQVFILIAVGTIIGLASSWVYRPFFLEKFPLPFPIGTATAQILNAVQHKGKPGLILLTSGIFSAAFAFIRDFLKKIPVVALGGSFLVSPMALGLGFLLKTSGIIWAVSGIVMHVLITPISMQYGLFSDLTHAQLWMKSLSMGLMISCGMMYLLISLWQNRSFFSLIFKNRSFIRPSTAFMVVISALAIWALLITYTPLTILQAALLIPIVFCTNFLSCIICGKTGINPLEKLGLTGFLCIMLITKVLPLQAIFIVLIGAVACGLCGDLMNDFQVGKVMHSSPRLMFLAEIFGAFCGIIITVIVFFAIKTTASLGSENFPAPQAVALSAMLSGKLYSEIFILGLALGLLLGLSRYGIMIALGIYMPLAISTPIGVGSLIHFLTPKKVQEQGALAAGGLLMGEGLAGSLIALWEMFKFKT